MPVEKLLSSLSMPPVHSTSKPSSLPSPSSSMPLLHWHGASPHNTTPLGSSTTSGGSEIGSAPASASGGSVSSTGSGAFWLGPPARSESLALAPWISSKVGTLSSQAAKNARHRAAQLVANRYSSIKHISFKGAGRRWLVAVVTRE